MTLLFSGLGNAGQAIVRAVCALWSCCQIAAHPAIRLVDNAVWRPHHARAGLVNVEEVGLPKTETTRRLLIDNGWPGDRIEADQVDVRDCPRTRCESGLTLGLTDSHETKALAVERALSVDSSAIAVGLGRTEAVVECFAASPTGAGYCCIHRQDDGYAQRHPCMPEGKPISTTETAGQSATDAAGRLVARLINHWFSTGSLPGDRGWTVTERGAGGFCYTRDPHCPGPHDDPADSTNTVLLRVTPRQIRIDELLDWLGTSATYADRSLAWNWHCRACGEQRLLHSVHPAACCPVCGMAMRAGFEQANGLDACELRALSGNGRVPTLAGMGLADERLLRCAVGDRIVWVRLKGV